MRNICEIKNAIQMEVGSFVSKVSILTYTVFHVCTYVYNVNNTIPWDDNKRI